MSQTPDERIAAIQARAEKATPGPWAWEDDGNELIYGTCQRATLYAGDRRRFHGLNLLGRLEPDGNGFSNLQFIAHAREDVPFLLSALATSEARCRDAESERDAAGRQCAEAERFGNKQEQRAIKAEARCRQLEQQLNRAVPIPADELAVIMRANEWETQAVVAEAGIRRVRFLCDIYAHNETTLTAAQIVAEIVRTLPQPTIKEIP